MKLIVDRVVGSALILLLAMSPEAFAASADVSNPGPPVTGSAVEQKGLPDAPSTTQRNGAQAGAFTQVAQAQNAPSQAQPDQASSPNAPTPSTTNAPQNQPAQPTQKDQQGQPVGAAAAQLGRTSGGAAAKPAGEALAPAKQHQGRSLLLKVGILGGAAVAIGTVVGLSAASPSRPPGAR
jgi:hypothetical protein